MKTKLLAALLLLLLAIPARADIVYVEQVSVVGKVTTSIVKIKGDKIRTDPFPETNPIAGISSIRDMATGGVITLRHATKTYTEYVVKENEPGRQPSPAVPPVYVATGDKEKVNGHDTEIYTAETSTMKFILWIDKDFPDGATVSGQLKKILAMESTGNHAPDVSKVDGVPVKIETVFKHAPPLMTLDRLIISAKVQPVDDSLFQVPAGYTLVEDNREVKIIK